MGGLISVIIPTYNRDKLLRECILSVHDQFYRPLEVIVVDDGSTDETDRVIKELKNSLDEKNFQILFFQQARKGAPAARNLGFLNSNGKYIQFLDSDDILLPHKLINEVECLESTNADLVYSKAQYVNEELLPIANKFWGETLRGSSDDYFNFSWQTMCALYKKETIEKGGLWQEDLTINQDWEFSIRYILYGFKICFLEEVNSLFRVHNQESIGKLLLSVPKIDGKVKSTLSVRHQVIQKNLLTRNLELKYFKRLVYCVLLFAELKETTKKKDLINFLSNEFIDLDLKQKMILKTLNFSGSIFAKFILKLYTYLKDKSY